MFARMLRFRALAVLASLIFLALVAPALAQESEAPGLPTDGASLAIFIGGILLGVAIMVLGKVAPRTKNTVDDKVLDFLTQAKPTLEKWLDPKDPSVPPSPQNPTGTAP